MAKKTPKSKKSRVNTLGPTKPAEKPAYNAAIELISVRRMALKEALAEMYGIQGREDS